MALWISYVFKKRSGKIIMWPKASSSVRQFCKALRSEALLLSVFQHLEKHSYITPQLETANKYKPTDDNFALDILGNVLLKNWESEWWKCVKKNASLLSLDDEFHISEGQNVEDCVLEHTKPFLLSGEGVATAGNVSQNSGSTRMLVIVQKQSANRESYEIQFEQLRFLKNFFNRPSRVKVVTEEDKETAREHDRVFYETDTGSYYFQEVKQHTACQEGRNGEGLLKTTFFINLKRLFLATIHDAYGERNGQKYLKLHPTLAPMKALVHHSCPLEHPDLRKVTLLVEEICTMLRSWNLTCWNAVEKNLTASDADALGAPFVISVPSDVMGTGILHLRSLHTTVSMEIHISQLGSTLLKYLN